MEIRRQAALGDPDRGDELVGGRRITEVDHVDPGHRVEAARAGQADGDRVEIVGERHRGERRGPVVVEVEVDTGSVERSLDLVAGDRRAVEPFAVGFDGVCIGADEAVEAGGRCTDFAR